MREGPRTLPLTLLPAATIWTSSPGALQLLRSGWRPSNPTLRRRAEALLESQRDQSLQSLCTMLGPSPDWFVGIDSVSLRENDDWLERIERELHAYDAGTDDGVTFTSANADSDPQDAIERILGAPFAAPAAPLARIVVERVL